MTTHSRILAWEIPWTEEPGGKESDMTLNACIQWLIMLSIFSWLICHHIPSWCSSDFCPIKKLESMSYNWFGRDFLCTLDTNILSSVFQYVFWNITLPPTLESFWKFSPNACTPDPMKFNAKDILHICLCPIALWRDTLRYLKVL